jgi:hypothetical protein
MSARWASLGRTLASTIVDQQRRAIREVTMEQTSIESLAIVPDIEPDGASV